MASSCTREDFDWILGEKMLHWNNFKAVFKAPGAWGCDGVSIPVCVQKAPAWHFGMWFRGQHSGAELMDGLEDLRGIFPTFMIVCHTSSAGVSCSGFRHS